MRPLKRVTLILLFSCGIVFAGLGLASGTILGNYTNSLMPVVMNHVRVMGLENPRVWFEKAQVSPQLLLRWLNIGARFDVGQEKYPIRFQGRVASVDARFPSWRFDEIEVRARDFTLKPYGYEVGNEERSEQEQSNKLNDILLEGSDFILVAPFDWESADERIKDLFRIVRDLVEGNRVPHAAQLEAQIQFRLNDKRVQARIYISQNDDGYGVAIQKKDLERILSEGDLQYTEQEVDLMARYPSRVPDLLDIKNEAQRTAREAHSQDSTVPEDAYRHILWSYLLALRYGPEFATEVTDAHESIQKDQNPLESEIDFVNNSVGRKYAREHLPRPLILETLMKDPGVIRR